MLPQVQPNELMILRREKKYQKNFFFFLFVFEIGPLYLPQASLEFAMYLSGESKSDWESKWIITECEQLGSNWKESKGWEKRKKGRSENTKLTNTNL
jgi:hypothetical protein